MRYLTQKEKIVLILLITSALVMVVVSIYAGKQKRPREVINNKIHVIHASGNIEPEFQENYAHSMHVYDPLLKSSDVVPADWNNIARDIGTVYTKYDAFIIVCGRDTLSYTASALSFMLENLDKPVILTDGELAPTILLASTTKIPEVMVSSRGKLLRGCRTVHKSTEYLTSPNYPSLKPYNSLTPPTEPIRIRFVSPKVKVIVIKIFPGIDERYLINLTSHTEVHGIVFEMYGTGTAPITDKMLAVIGLLAKRGVIMVAVSQCDRMPVSTVDIDPRLIEAGVLNGQDMTTPAAYAKLCFLLGNIEEKQLIGALMEHSFRGELSTT